MNREDNVSQQRIQACVFTKQHAPAQLSYELKNLFQLADLRAAVQKLQKESNNILSNAVTAENENTKRSSTTSLSGDNETSEDEDEEDSSNITAEKRQKMDEELL